uniref:CUE domain-containing protein n=1 Tax=Rhabditophanes sp. KR3021 TaxID=114890 RepID=A0AC35TP23_9BILA
MDVPSRFIQHMLEAYPNTNFSARVSELAADIYENVDKEEVRELASEVMNNLHTINFTRPQQIYKESKAEAILLEVKNRDREVKSKLTGKVTAHDHFLWNFAKSLEEEVKQLEKEVGELQHQNS